MKEIMNAWRNQPKTLMKKETLEKHQNYTTQESHQKTKSAFSTMLFELFGNKSLTETCIRYPVCSAEQPASIFKDVAQAWKAAHNSQELKNERLRSKTTNDSARLCKQIHALTVRRVHANKLVKLIDESWNIWYALSLQDRKLWEEHDDKYICRQIEELRSQQLPRFPGVSSSIARSMKK